MPVDDIVFQSNPPFILEVPAQTPGTIRALSLDGVFDFTNATEIITIQIS